jgi:hypothetical protein
MGFRIFAWFVISRVTTSKKKNMKEGKIYDVLVHSLFHTLGNWQ